MIDSEDFRVTAPKSMTKNVIPNCLICCNGISQVTKDRLGIVKYYEKCGEYSITGIASYDTIYSNVFGYEFVNYNELKSDGYDVVIILEADITLRNIRNRLLTHGFSDKLIIPYSAMTFDGFSVEKYAQLITSKVSIFSNNCWGGLLSHSLGLQFNSPFINMFLGENDYIKFLNRPQYYMSLPITLHSTEYSSGTKIEYPIAQCGDIFLRFNHYASFEEAQSCWEKRKARINWENLFVMFFTEHPDIAHRFAELPYEKKICFVPSGRGGEHIVPINYANQLLEQFKIPFWDVVNQIAKGRYQYYNVFDLLLDGKFTRTAIPREE